MAPRPADNCALHVRHSYVVLRGAGASAAFLFNDSPVMRERSVVRVALAAGGSWYGPERAAVELAPDVSLPSHELALASRPEFSDGDWVVVRADATDGWIAGHHMTGKWTPERLRGLTFLRRALRVDAGGSDGAAATVTLDAPTRYPLLRRDRARVYAVEPPLSDVGIEHLGIGMRENSTPGMAENDYQVPGTGGYEAHGACAIEMQHVVDGWIRGVASYRPDSNRGDVHLLSNGIHLGQSACVTLADCALAQPQYLGGGGNGYLYSLAGNDCLVVGCEARRGRHNYYFRGPHTSGNVILRCTLRDGLLASDFHMHLSVANLIDSPTLDGELLEAAYRPYGTTEHGETTSQSVFWNVRGERAYPRLPVPLAVVSQQFGWGYVIGTSGACAGVALASGRGTEPIDFAEGLGEGEMLDPQSLYEDQLRRRLRQAR